MVVHNDRKNGGSSSSVDEVTVDAIVRPDPLAVVLAEYSEVSAEMRAAQDDGSSWLRLAYGALSLTVTAIVAAAQYAPELAGPLLLMPTGLLCCSLAMYLRADIKRARALLYLGTLCTERAEYIARERPLLAWHDYARSSVKSLRGSVWLGKLDKVYMGRFVAGMSILLPIATMLVVAAISRGTKFFPDDPAVANVSTGLWGLEVALAGLVLMFMFKTASKPDPEPMFSRITQWPNRVETRLGEWNKPSR